MSQRRNWRDCQEWKSFGIPLSTSNNEACKLFDAAVTQLVGWYDDPSLGGLVDTLKALLEADLDFIMGHAIGLGIDMFVVTRWPRDDPVFRSKLDTLKKLADGAGLSDYERLHAKAIVSMADGRLSAAADAWESVLLSYPQDILAVKFAYDCYFYMGCAPERRDLVAKVLPRWTPSMPLYGYLLGLYSFSLCETNMFKKAETYGLQSLELNPRDAWATHAMAHIYSMEGRYQEGQEFMKTTVREWSSCEPLACHNYWHWAVYHVDEGKYQEALDIYDSEVERLTQKYRSSFNLTDAGSLLYRLNLEGVKVGDRWKDLYEVSRSLMDKNTHTFIDSHSVMSLLGAGHIDVAQTFIAEMKRFSEEGDTHNHVIKKEVGAAICESFLAYEEGDYSRAVDLLHPIKYRIYKVGGSDAQRDIYNQFLIHAAMKSSKTEHNKLARALLIERKELNGNSPLTERLIMKSLAAHGVN